MRAPVPPVTPKEPKPKPIQLRAPQSKSERRLVARLKAAFKGRERAQHQYVACSKALEKLHKELEAAGMIHNAD